MLAAAGTRPSLVSLELLETDVGSADDAARVAEALDGALASNRSLRTVTLRLGCSLEAGRAVAETMRSVAERHGCQLTLLGAQVAEAE